MKRDDAAIDSRGITAEECRVMAYVHQTRAVLAGLEIAALGLDCPEFTFEQLVHEARAQSLRELGPRTLKYYTDERALRTLVEGASFLKTLPDGRLALVELDELPRRTQTH